MSERTATRHLNKLANVRGQIATLVAERNEKVADVLTPKQVQQQIEIEQAYDKQLSPLYKQEGDLVAKVKTAVLKLKKTVRGTDIMAVFGKASTKWNTDKLEGYAVEHKAVLKFKELGSPSVAIRKAKK